MHRRSLFKQNVFMVPSFNKDDCSELFTLVILDFILPMNNILSAWVFSRLEALRFKAALGRALWLGLGQLLEARGLGWLDLLYGKRSLLLLDAEAGAPEPPSLMQSEIQASLFFT